MRNIITIVRTVFSSFGSSGTIVNLARQMVLLALLAIFASSASAEKILTPSQFNLKNYRGKVVYLDFWASWCGPCRFSFPYMEHLTNTYGDKGLVVIADNLDHSRASARAFLRTAHVDFPIIFDPKGVLATRYKVKDMPTSVLIGRDGKVRFVHQGFYKERENEYTSHVLDLIDENN